MRKTNVGTALIVIAALAMTSGVSFAGFVRFKKPAAKTPTAPVVAPVSPPPSSPAPLDPTPAIIRGRYKILCIGTGGPDALEPGNDGVVTIPADGRFSGTLYYYDDGSRGILSGILNQSGSTGEGSATLINSQRGWISYYTLKCKATAQQFSVIQGEYQQIGSASKGIFWCIQESP